MTTSAEPISGGETALAVTIVTLFPGMFASWLHSGVVARAMERGVAAITLVDLRLYGIGRHQITDDYPFGGGAGMVLKPEPIFAAVESIGAGSDTPVILLSPRGRRLNQDMIEALSHNRDLILIAGHYEGVDERVRQHCATDEISIGDYVLSNGELAAMVLADAVIRLIPGAIATGSMDEESFTGGLLEYPHYTRPATFRDWSVPEVLLSGNHGEIRRWRRRQSLRATARYRPDLLQSAVVAPDEREWLAADSPDL